MKKFLIPSIAVTIMSLGACNDFRCIEGNYDLRTEYRSPGDFDEVVLEGSFDVRIVEDSINEVIVEAESNIIPYIRTSVSGNTLELSVVNSKCLRNHERILVTVKAVKVSSVAITGSGMMYVEKVSGQTAKLFISGSGELNAGVDAGSVTALISGSGDIETWGVAYEGDYSITGSGNIYAYGLTLNRCEAGISGSGSMYVTVSDYLDVDISGSGDVYYKGHPQVHTHITGSGKVVGISGK